MIRFFSCDLFLDAHCKAMFDSQMARHDPLNRKVIESRAKLQSKGYRAKVKVYDQTMPEYVKLLDKPRV